MVPEYGSLSVSPRAGVFEGTRMELEHQRLGFQRVGDSDRGGRTPIQSLRIRPILVYFCDMKGYI
jgi:hypothetical protein